MSIYEWRLKAFQEVEETAEYLATEFSLQVSENFLKRIDDTIEKVCKHPTIGKPSRKFKTIRSYKVDKSRRLYYRTIGRKIVILRVFDHKQDPEKLKY